MYDFIIGHLFLTVLSLSLSGALIGIGIAAIRPLTGRCFSKKWNYYIWLLVVARLLIPFRLETNFPGLPDLHANVSTKNAALQTDSAIPGGDVLTQSASVIQPETGSQADLTTPVGGTLHGSTSTSQYHDRQTDLTQPETRPSADAHTALPDASSGETVPAALRDTVLSATGMWTAAVFIWIFGAVFALLTKLSCYRRFQKALKTDCTRVTDSRILTLENVLCAGLRITRIPAIYESASVHSPITIGLWKPAVILPKTVCDQAVDPCMPADSVRCGFCSLTQLQLVLHHELIHVARRDLLYKWIYQLLLCVHWFNPVLHRIGRQLNSDCELSCDEAILPELTATGKQLYGNILLDAAELGIDRRQSAFATTLLENKRDLKRRLHAILHYKKATRFRIALSACVFSVMLALSACGAIWVVADPDEPNPHDASDGSGMLSQMTTTPVSSDSDSSFSDRPTTVSSLFYDQLSPDRSGDAWKVYDDDEMLAGRDILDQNYATVCIENDNRFLAEHYALFGSNSFIIAYADRDIDVEITSSFTVREGNFKIIHVTPDKSVVTLNDTGEQTTSTVTMTKGRNVLKMVGQGGKVENLEIRYSDIKESDFEKLFHDEAAEYVYQVKNGLVPVEKDRIVDALYLMDEEDASEMFNILLADNTAFTPDELCYFFIYSDSELSSGYLLRALRDNTIAPLSADAVLDIMPFLEGPCKLEVLRQLPAEDFCDTFLQSFYYLDSDEIVACLTAYTANGGTLTLSLFHEISPYLDEDSIDKLDQLMK